MTIRFPRLMLLLPLLAGSGYAASPSALAARGYAVLPEPQRVTLATGDFRFGNGWALKLNNIPATDIAAVSLNEGLASRLHVKLARNGSSTVTLALAPGSVTIGEALDSDKAALTAQAYQLDLAPNAVTVRANAAPGLFYGVQTLLQLAKPRDGGVYLPEGKIVDWPDLRLREIYWDDAHHLDRPEVLRDAIRQAAFYKLNGFSIKLEGHFQFKSMPAIVEPYAMTPAEFQALTDYALKYHVQLIPWMDGPSHIAFILKHPEYAHLREFPDNNYEACAVNPDTYKMYEGLFKDLLDANRGGKYFHLSTDEAYYVGLANSPACNEAARAKELGSVGKLLAEFITKTAGWLHGQGREVIFWGEYPLKPDDIGALPSYMINGEVNGPRFDPVFRKHGIRQTIYTSTQGEEPHFPDYAFMPADKRLHSVRGRQTPRVAGVIQTVTKNSARQNSELLGVITAGWADSGLHPETFWLGFAAGPAAAWNPAGPGAEQASANFYPLFYGWKTVSMDNVYRLMASQAQFWADSWERGPSKSRKGIWGSSNRIFNPRHDATDQFIPLPPAPTAELAYSSTWSKDNAKRVELAREFLASNDELLGLLKKNQQLADFNRYNLEVYQSIAQLLRQNLTMLADLNRMDLLLAKAAGAAASQPGQAVGAVDEALALASKIRAERNVALRDLTQTWYKSWYPRVPEANGRKFLHELDDVKDHIGDRTVDLSYTIQREFLLPFGEWVGQVRAARNQYAKAHGLAANTQTFDWKDTAAVR